LKVESFLGISHFNYDKELEHIKHEFQEGSRYEAYCASIIRELALEFELHNDLLGLLLGKEIPWTSQLESDKFWLGSVL
jgi:hypothetical protein